MGKFIITLILIQAVLILSIFLMEGIKHSFIMEKTTCGTLKGGFIESEHFGKDDPEYLSDMIRSYELILQQNGNFNTRSSNLDEAF